MAARGKQAAGAKKKAPPRARWQADFLAALAHSSNVTLAAQKAGVDVSTVYRSRRAEPDFYRRWQEALAEGYDNLEMDLLHRLRIGQLEGGKAQARRKFDNAIAFRLLTAHREAVGRQKALRASEDEDAIIASITEKLEKMKERQEAARAMAEEDSAYQAGAPADDE
ncbi:hypothetical protein N0B51_01520 [Tsuneonella sp. YG55]|uniref:Homeodomain phBC6A51-type domain-containing protein n=1 Tax=Tsuneonella litorea TaxID=2976475 RepID=A0A9X2VZ09_9SPHN|nr:hypothetical protein [Tsuneonella litorea]MCT2557653.1 hypothetical protein [Tsuneonella litorea]